MGAQKTKTGKGGELNLPAPRMSTVPPFKIWGGFLQERKNAFPCNLYYQEAAQEEAPRTNGGSPGQCQSHLVRPVANRYGPSQRRAFRTLRAPCFFDIRLTPFEDFVLQGVHGLDDANLLSGLT